MLRRGCSPGILCVLFLRRTRPEPPGIRLRDLLTRFKEQGGASAEHLAARPIDRRRGVLYGIGGAALLLAAIFTPLPAQGREASDALRLIQQVNVLGLFLIVRARRYFQVSADSLLAVDKRPPILFLRSFADDERQRYSALIFFWSFRDQSRKLLVAISRRRRGEERRGSLRWGKLCNHDR